MLRRLILPALAAGFMATSAQASALTDTAAPANAKEYRDAGLLLAQNADVEIYFDGAGNRVIVDAYTGEVLSVQPPRRKLTREGQRRLLRQRERRQNRYYLDDPEDMARLRSEDPYFDQQLDPPPGEFEEPSASRDFAPDEFPDAPRDRSADPTEEPAPPVRQKVKRQPLAEPKVAEIEPDQTSGVPKTAEIVAPAATEPPITFSAREEVAAVQVLMDRAGASPGVIDGRFGSNVDKAFAAYRTLTGSNLKSTDAAGIEAALAASGGDPFINYTITAEDAAGPFVASIPTDYSEKAQLPAMSFMSVPEMLGERFHMDETYLKALNPEANFSRPGTIVRVANVGANISGKVARITADKAQKQVLAYDAYDKLVAAYPATIGSSDTPSPTGTHAVSRIAFNPDYTYNPKLNFKQGENDKVLTIPPGPNGPVGSIWIALDKPTYGVHGTPDPSKIGKTESHGCVRLTNWDAAELAKLVSSGVTVEFLE